MKTTIVPLVISRDERRCRYVHNTIVADLDGDDFDGIFGPPSVALPEVLPPYVEIIRYQPRDRAEGAAAQSAAAHLERRPDHNPIGDLSRGVQHAAEWLRDSPPERFHAWTFATLRQCGAAAELAAALCASPATGLSAQAAPYFEEVARSAKAVQFKMARVTRGRSVDLTDQLAAMERAQADAFVALGKPYAPAVEGSSEVAADPCHE